MTYGRPPDSVPVDSFPPAPSMAVGQYGVCKGLLGPGHARSFSPPFPEFREGPEEVTVLHSQEVLPGSRSYGSNFLKCISLKIQIARLFVRLSEISEPFCNMHQSFGSKRM